MTWLVEGLAGPAAGDLAERFTLPGDALLEVRHRAERTELALSVEDGGAAVRAEAAWSRGEALAGLHAMLAGMDPDAWPRGAPLELLLPDARSLETRCSCRGRQPCRHALAALYAFARAVESDPSALSRDTRRRVEELGDRPTGIEVTSALPGPPSPSEVFWLYDPPASQLVVEEADFPAANGGDPFQAALLAAMRAVRAARLG
jgi:hypothetical protein